jgi:PAS domain S-box-containing protein
MQSQKEKLQAQNEALEAQLEEQRLTSEELEKANSELEIQVQERKQAEEALRETSNYLENLINYANAPIIVWGPDFRITRFNHAFERLTGYNSGDVVGQALDILFPEESKDESLVKIKRTLAGEYWESVEIPILRKDGSTRIALWNSANIHSKDGKTLLATIAQGQDITERKMIEEAL